MSTEGRTKGAARCAWSSQAVARTGAESYVGLERV
jgi:hypothetical protein